MQHWLYAGRNLKLLAFFLVNSGNRKKLDPRYSSSASNRFMSDPGENQTWIAGKFPMCFNDFDIKTYKNQHKSSMDFPYGPDFIPIKSP